MWIRVTQTDPGVDSDGAVRVIETAGRIDRCGSRSQQQDRPRHDSAHDGGAGRGKVRLLLSRGAKVTAKPVTIAASWRGTAASLRLLVEHNADADLPKPWNALR